LENRSSEYKLALLTILWKWVDQKDLWKSETTIATLLHLANDSDRNVQTNALDLLVALFTHGVYRDIMSDQDWFQRLHHFIDASDASLALLPLWFILAHIYSRLYACHDCIVHLAMGFVSPGNLEDTDCQFVAAERALIEKVHLRLYFAISESNMPIHNLVC
jgi:hypothetical protein